MIKIKEDLNKTELKKVFKDGVNKETSEILTVVSVEEKQTFL